MLLWPYVKHQPLNTNLLQRMSSANFVSKRDALCVDPKATSLDHRNCTKLNQIVTAFSSEAL